MSFLKRERLIVGQLVWSAAVALAAPFVCFAADPRSEGAPQPASSPPRIGLALSGGGARGAAHIGVLKVLEELRIPVHCIAGTSMGAIVGGSFASGVTPARLEQVVRTTDWSKAFIDRPPRQELSTRRKIDDYKTLFAPEYGLKDNRLALPKGILAGVSIETLIRELTQASVGIDDFQKLPIPFRAVAADIETGEAVVLQRGNVAQAMRASMSIPGVMSPVAIGGRLLVDGSIANNFPIDEVRRMCADVVIAVDISTPPLKREEINSAISVSLQLVNLLGKVTVEQQIKTLTERDVLVSPELGDISSGSFERAAEAVRIGESTARASADSLRRYSVSEEQYAAFRSRQRVEAKGLGTVDEIRFEGLRLTNAEVLHSLVHSKPGEPLSEQEIGADLRRIYGRGDFESVDYSIVQEQGRRIMLIQPREKDWGPNYLRFGLGLASDFHGDSSFNALVSYRRTWMNQLGAEWLTELQVGQDNHLSTEFYQPIEKRGRYFVAPGAGLRQTTRGLFVGDSRVAEYEVTELRAGIDAGMALGTWGEIRVGPQWRRIDASVDTGAPVLPAVKETTAGVRALLFADQNAQPFFPREGHRTTLSAYVADGGLGSDRNYKRLLGDFSKAMSWGRHTLNLNLHGGTDFHSDLPAYEAFTLGGPLRLSGYRINEFAGRQVLFSRVMYYHRALALPELLGSGVYFGTSLEAGSMKRRYDAFPSTGTVWSGSAFLAADTFLGPAYFGVGAGESGRWSLYLLLGAP